MLSDSQRVECNNTMTVDMGCRGAIGVVKYLQSQRQDGGSLCDVELVVGDSHMFAHLSVLAVHSQYFREKFGSNGSDNGKKVINMTNLYPDLETTETVISSMYTCTLTLTPENLNGVFGMCRFLAYERAQRACEQYMLHRLCVTNCIDYWAITTNRATMSDLQAEASRFLHNRFHDSVMYEDKVLDLEHVCFLELLKANVHQFCSPRQLLTLVLKKLIRSGSNLTSIENFKSYLEIIGTTDVRYLDLTIKTAKNVLRVEGFDTKVVEEICSHLAGYVVKSSAPSDLMSPILGRDPFLEYMMARVNTRDDWGLNVLHDHPPLEPEANVIIVITPADEAKLGIYAYVITSGRWVDFGQVKCPERPKTDTRHRLRSKQPALLKVAYYQTLIADGKIYFFSKFVVFILHLQSGRWQRWRTFVVSERIGPRVLFFKPNIVNNELIIFVAQERYPVYIGRINDRGFFEIILCCHGDLGPKNCDSAATSVVGNQVCVFLRERDSEPTIVLVFDVALKSFRRLDMDCPISLNFTPSLLTLLNEQSQIEHPTLQHDGWTYIVHEKDNKAFLRLKENDKGQMTVEELNEEFPSDFSIEGTKVVSAGSSLWRLREKTTPSKTDLLEVSICRLDVMELHCPPPCNRILAAASGKLDKDFVTRFPLARFHMIGSVVKQTTDHEMKLSPLSAYRSTQLSTNEQSRRPYRPANRSRGIRGRRGNSRSLGYRL